MIVRESEWKDSIPAEHPGEVVVRLLPDGTRVVYREGRDPLTVPAYTPRYTTEVRRG